MRMLRMWRNMESQILNNGIMWYGSKFFILAVVAGMLTSCSCSSDTNIYEDDDSEESVEAEVVGYSDESLYVFPQTEKESPKVNEQQPSPAPARKPDTHISRAYEEGYDTGYDDGEDDAINGMGFQYQYDDENNYRGKEKDDYETGYCEGYEAGYDDNYEYADG